MMISHNTRDKKNTLLLDNFSAYLACGTTAVSCRTRARLCRCLRLSRAALVVGRRQGRVVLPPGIVGMECAISARCAHCALEVAFG